MKTTAYIVNAFTESIASGNPAGVVLLDDDIEDELMQKIAVDIGKSETAFIRFLGNNEFQIRWFSPIREVKLCGHASLAAAKVINNQKHFNKIKFHYLEGIFEVSIGIDGYISLSFPLDKYEILGNDDRYEKFFGNLPIIECIKGIKTGKVIIIVDSMFDLREIKPNFEFMKNESGIFENGIGISKRSNKYDIESRYFNPWYGVNEDPVTGSVYTVLASYWYDKIGICNISAYQTSNRPGELLLEVQKEKVQITGKARIVFEGSLLI